MHRVALATLLLVAACTRSQPAAPRPIVLATTTSFQDSGLLDALVSRFRASGGPPVKPIAVGTGEALAMGERGDADVLVVHAPKAEEAFMAAGHGRNRRALWHNDFVIVGPPDDPAGAKAQRTTPDVLRAIAAANAIWASRGDESGTHKKEQQLFAAAGLKPWPAVLSTGQGMGETLRIASEKRGYTLTDRGTFLKLKTSLSLDLILQGDPPLLNPYHVIEVAPAKHPNVNADGARRWADFLVSPETQAFVGGFGREQFGEPLFFPDAATERHEPSR